MNETTTKRSTPTATGESGKRKRPSKKEQTQFLTVLMDQNPAFQAAVNSAAQAVGRLPDRELQTIIGLPQLERLLLVEHIGRQILPPPRKRGQPQTAETLGDLLLDPFVRAICKALSKNPDAKVPEIIREIANLPEIEALPLRSGIREQVRKRIKRCRALVKSAGWPVWE